MSAFVLVSPSVRPSTRQWKTRYADLTLWHASSNSKPKLCVLPNILIKEIFGAHGTSFVGRTWSCEKAKSVDFKFGKSARLRFKFKSNTIIGSYSSSNLFSLYFSSDENCADDKTCAGYLVSWTVDYTLCKMQITISIFFFFCHIYIYIRTTYIHPHFIVRTNLNNFNYDAFEWYHISGIERLLHYFSSAV